MALNLCRAVRGIGGRLTKRALHTTSVIRSDVPTRMNIPSDEDQKLDQDSEANISKRMSYPRLEFLEKLAGKMDPFDFGMHEIGKEGQDGTFGTPVLIPSMYKARLVACVCEDDVGTIEWMTISKGEKKRCGCGLWFKFVDLRDPTIVDPMDQIA